MSIKLISQFKKIHIGSARFYGIVLNALSIYSAICYDVILTAPLFCVIIICFCIGMILIYRSIKLGSVVNTTNK